MGVGELEVAGRFQVVLEVAARTGDREGLYPFLAFNVEWVTAMRTLRGIDEVREQMIWGLPPEHLDLAFAVSEWADVAPGRVACDVHEVYRMKETAAFAYERDLHIELTIREGKICRYEMRIIG